jgi:DNA-binding NarL/FixJ family response regulator
VSPGGGVTPGRESAAFAGRTGRGLRPPPGRLEGILERFGHTVVASVGDAEQLRRAVAEDAPDLVVTDVRMPPTFTDEGLQAALELRRMRPGLPVIVLSQYVQQTYAVELMATPDGGVGYLLKDRIADVTDFARSLDVVAAGGTMVDPDVVRQLIANRHDPVGRLSPREREVLALMAQGHANADIARKLVVTEAAVAKHIGSLLMKLDLPPDVAGHRRVPAVLRYLQS